MLATAEGLAGYRRMMSDFAMCRTDARGGRILCCPDYGTRVVAYNRIRSGIYDEVVGFYETPGDLAVDLGSLASFVSGKLPEVSANASILADALSSAVYRKYDDGDPETSGLSVHYVPVDAAGFPLRHDSAYFRGALVGNALEFVEGSSWVPNEQDESGLLYRLWYEVFE